MFEAITKDEFDNSGVSLADPDGTRSATLPPVNVAGTPEASGTVTLEPGRGGSDASVPGTVSVEGVGSVAAGNTHPLVYCDFCKGYYYEEYHYGDKDESSR